MNFSTIPNGGYSHRIISAEVCLGYGYLMKKALVVGIIEGVEFLVLFLASFSAYAVAVYLSVGDVYHLSAFVTPTVVGYWGLLSIVVFRISEKQLAPIYRYGLVLILSLVMPQFWRLVDEPWVTLTSKEEGALYVGAMIAGLVLLLLVRVASRLNMKLGLHTK